MTPQQKLGKTLRDLRTSAGVSLNEFANQIFVGPNQLSFLENGKIEAPSIWIIQDYVKAFGATLNDVTPTSPKRKKRQWTFSNSAQKNDTLSIFDYFVLEHVRDQNKELHKSPLAPKTLSGLYKRKLIEKVNSTFMWALTEKGKALL